MAVTQQVTPAGQQGGERTEAQGPCDPDREATTVNSRTPLPILDSPYFTVESQLTHYPSQLQQPCRLVCWQADAPRNEWKAEPGTDLHGLYAPLVGPLPCLCGESRWGRQQELLPDAFQISWAVFPALGRWSVRD